MTAECSKYKCGSILQGKPSNINENTEEGPLYNCTCAHNTWLTYSVFHVDNIHMTTDDEINMLQNVQLMS